MTPAVLAALLGVTSVLLVTRRAWSLVALAGLLALLCLHVAVHPFVAKPARLVVDEVQP